LPVFRLAHLSDPHLPPPALPQRGLSAKQRLSMLAWRRKRHRHRADVLNAITADVAQADLDHIVVTGDLTNFATPPEYAVASRWLEGLGSAHKVTVSPGNHDALAGTGGVARFAPWLRWLGDASDIQFPMLRRRGPVAILNLCSALPTALHKAEGRIGPDQAGRLAGALRAAGESGLFRVLLVHHPVRGGIVPRRAELVDHGLLRQVLQTAGAELILHGHSHEASLSHVGGPAGNIPVLGVPSASGAPGYGEAARWHLIEIDSDNPGRIAVTARGLNSDGAIGELGRYTVLGRQG
jgi:3',5'-cyclic AMP phosphodiesterase CpdA